MVVLNQAAASWLRDEAAAEPASALSAQVMAAKAQNAERSARQRAIRAQRAAEGSARMERCRQYCHTIDAPHSH